MINLQLDSDEGILLQATEIERYGEREDVLDELVLTNKNLIYSYEFKTGMFSKAETRVEKISLNNIKVVNGKVQIMRVDHDDYGDVMQVLYTDGRREYFMFFNPKKDIPKWINAINFAVTGDDTPIVEESAEKKRTGFFPTMKREKTMQQFEQVESVVGDRGGSNSVEVAAGVNAFASGIVNMVDSAVQRIDSATKQLSEVVRDNSVAQYQEKTQVEPMREQVSEIKTGNQFCSNCGEKLQVGARFCHGCGNKVGQNIEITPAITPKEEAVKTNLSERMQEYAGKVIKCVHCGAVITQTTVICPECGNKITGASAVSSVQEFQNQLMAIESTRKPAKGGLFAVYTPADPADKKKLALIRNYSIPNTIDDILEFMLLAIANIDVSLSKKSWQNSQYNNMEVLSWEMPRIISDAWVAKMQQMYQKAEILFPNEPTFERIKKLYFDKMAELKMK